MSIDIEQILSLDQLNMTPILEKSGIQFDPNRRRAGLLANISRGAVFGVVEREGRIVAYVECSPEADRSIRINSIQVHPDYQRRYILRELLIQLHLNLRSSCFTVVKTDVHNFNGASLALHEKLGFKSVEQKADRISFEIQCSDLLSRLSQFAR